MYPIHDIDGNIVNIGGRILDPEWKEKGMRKYTYLSGWGEMSVIYGLYENMKYILEKKEIILFEDVSQFSLQIHGEYITPGHY